MTWNREVVDLEEDWVLAVVISRWVFRVAADVILAHPDLGNVFVPLFSEV